MNTNTITPVRSTSANEILVADDLDKKSANRAWSRLLAGPSIRFTLITLMGAVLLVTRANPLLSFVGLIGIDLVTLATLAFVMKSEGKRLRDLFVLQRHDILWSAAYAVMMTVGFIVSNFSANIIVFHGAPAMSSAAVDIPLWIGVAALVAPATTALAEEGLYRAYMMPRATALTGPVVALLLTSFYFGFQHIGFAMGSAEGVIAKVLTTFFAGLIFAGLWAWHKRAVPLVVGHWVLDLLFLGLPVFLMAH